MQSVDCEILILGAGPAGLSAALAAARCGKSVIILDDNPRPAAHNRFDRRMPESDLEAETMSDHMNDCCEYNVACDVSNCAYNADGKRCHADHIQVKNTQGTSTCKDETFCSTFTKKGRAAF